MHEPHLNNPIRRLVLLKDSIRDVYEMQKNEFKDPEVVSLEDDKLGITMSCLRAIGRGRWLFVDRCAQAYPKLKDWTRNKQEACSAHNILAIRNHAVELYKEQIARDVQAINNMPENMADQKAQARQRHGRMLKAPAPECDSNSERTFVPTEHMALGVII